MATGNTNSLSLLLEQEIIANPTLDGTESELTGLQIEDTKYKVPSGGDIHLYRHNIYCKVTFDSSNYFYIGFICYNNDSTKITNFSDIVALIYDKEYSYSKKVSSTIYHHYKNDLWHSENIYYNNAWHSIVYAYTYAISNTTASLDFYLYTIKNSTSEFVLINFAKSAFDDDIVTQLF